MSASPHADGVATWRGPKSGPPALLRWANRLGRPLGRFVHLDESYLVERALRSHPDFPAERIEFRDGLRALSRSLEREARLNFLGRIAAQQDLLRLIRTQIRVLRELDRHPRSVG